MANKKVDGIVKIIGFLAILGVVFLIARTAFAGNLTLIVVRHVFEGTEFATPIRIKTNRQHKGGINYKAWANFDQLSLVLNKLANRKAKGEIAHTGTALRASRTQMSDCIRSSAKPQTIVSKITKSRQNQSESARLNSELGKRSLLCQLQSSNQFHLGDIG